MQVTTVGYRLTILAMMICACGCASLGDYKYELIQNVRTRCAWSDFDSGFSFVSRYSSDYRDGWQQGFYSVLTGGDGRPPVIPPRRYWESSFFCCANPCGQEEWLQGFQCGASEATRHCREHFVVPILTQNCCPVVTSVTSQSATAAFASSPTEIPESQVSETPVTSIRLLGIQPVIVAPVERAETQLPPNDHGSPSVNQPPIDLVPRLKVPSGSGERR